MSHSPVFAWWRSDLASVFEGYPAARRQTCLTYVSIIADRLQADGRWTSVRLGRSAYQAAQSWARSGKWDLILVALHLAGRTASWPATSTRWGDEPFNRFGYPNTGFFSIVSLTQAAKYREEGGLIAAVPFPIQQAFLRADNWR